MSKIVLCVDDSATMQMVADITFRGTEFTYIGARSSDEALEKVKSGKPVLILADAQMPGQGKSGYDLCLALKSDAKTADVPVVILIGNTGPYDAARGAQVGADANLPKPWDTQTMLEKVIEIVGRGTSAKPGAAAPAPVAAAAAASAAPTMPLAAAAKSAQNPAAVAAAAAAAGMPPRSATIMGMPTIKMPGGVAPTATSAPLAAPAPAPVAAAPSTPAPVSPSVTNKTNQVPPPAAASGPTPRQPAPPAPAPAHATLNTASRAPMIAGTPTKRSALVERTLAKMASQLAAAAGLEPGSPELLALLKLSTEIVERIVWEVVPELAEAIIKENLHDLTARRS